MEGVLLSLLPVVVVVISSVAVAVVDVVVFWAIVVEGEPVFVLSLESVLVPPSLVAASSVGVSNEVNSVCQSRDAVDEGAVVSAVGATAHPGHKSSSSMV